ncbi:MAG: cytosine deaminase, partial [Cyanobacteriota bacterium]
MTLEASGHLAARVPRSLLDAQGAVGPTPDEDGCLAVALDWAEGRITSIVPLDSDRTAAPLPLVLTPLVEPHAHLDKVFTASAFPNREGTMQAALAANRREWTARTAEQVLERGERALELAWRQGVRAIRSHLDGGGPVARPSWEALRQLQQRWRGRVELQLVLLAPLQFWSTPEGERQARELAATGGWIGGVLGPPYRFNAAVPQQLLQLLRLAERLGAGVDLH